MFKSHKLQPIESSRWYWLWVTNFWTRKPLFGYSQWRSLPTPVPSSRLGLTSRGTCYHRTYMNEYLGRRWDLLPMVPDKKPRYQGKTRVHTNWKSIFWNLIMCRYEIICRFCVKTFLHANNTWINASSGAAPKQLQLNRKLTRATATESLRNWTSLSPVVVTFITFPSLYFHKEGWREHTFSNAEFATSSTHKAHTNFGTLNTRFAACASSISLAKRSIEASRKTHCTLKTHTCKFSQGSW